MTGCADDQVSGGALLSQFLPIVSTESIERDHR